MNHTPSTMPSPDRRIGTRARSAGSMPCVSYSAPRGVRSWFQSDLVDMDMGALSSDLSSACLESIWILQCQSW